jgi:hypothetical protein
VPRAQSVSANQKSGTNRNSRRSLRVQHRNASLNAEDFFSNREGLAKPKYIRNQFGGEVDGPIKKDKSFFSFAYDRIKLTGRFSAGQHIRPDERRRCLPFKRMADRWQMPYLAARSARYFGTNRVPILPEPVRVRTIGATVYRTLSAALLLFRPSHGYRRRLLTAALIKTSVQKIVCSVSVNYYRQTIADKFGGGPLVTTGPISSSTFNHFHNISVTETHIFKPASSQRIHHCS